MSADPLLPPVSDPLPSAAVTAPPPPRSHFYTSLGEVVLCSGVPTQLLIGGLLWLLGVRVDASGKLTPTFIFALALGDTILLLALITWLLWRRGERVGSVVFGDKPIAPEVVAGILSFPFVIVVVIAASLLIRLLVPGLHNVSENPFETMIDSRSAALTVGAMGILAGGIREEVQRAFLLHRFRTDLGGIGIGLVVTSVAFGLGHAEVQGWDAAVITGLLGAMWGVLYAIRRSAVAGMVSHSIFNSLEVVRAFF